MSVAISIARRELRGYFRQPAGWIMVALYLFLTALVFSLFTLSPGQPASMRDFFAVSGWLLLPVAPAISMRLIAEELRTGTIENLLTAPVGSAGLVIGKYLGAVGFLIAMLLPTPVFVYVLSVFANMPLDPGPILAGYLCIVLLGMLYLSVGTFASCLTSNSTLAFMMTLFGILALMFAGAAAAYVGSSNNTAGDVLAFMSLPARISDFAKGVVDTSNLVFFIGGVVWFIALAIGVMELRRWR